jgi:hypothetical protein
VKKWLDHSWIEVNNEVLYTVVVDNQDHPQVMKIHGKLKRLLGLMHAVLLHHHS